MSSHEELFSIEVMCKEEAHDDHAYNSKHKNNTFTSPIELT